MEEGDPWFSILPIGKTNRKKSFREQGEKTKDLDLCFWSSCSNRDQIFLLSEATQNQEKIRRQQVQDTGHQAVTNSCPCALQLPQHTALKNNVLFHTAKVHEGETESEPSTVEKLNKHC